MNSDKQVAPAPPSTEVQVTAPALVGFHAFYDEHFPRLVAMLLATGRFTSLQDAEDAVNTAMIPMLKRWDKVAEPTAYLFVSARNELRKQWAQDQRLGGRVGEGGMLPTEGALDPGLTRLEDEEWVQGLLRRLSPRQRQAMIFTLEGIEPAEAARLTGTSAETLRRRLCDARKTLTRMLVAENETMKEGR